MYGKTRDLLGTCKELVLGKYDQKMFPPAGANWGFFPGGGPGLGPDYALLLGETTREGEFGPGGPQQMTQVGRRQVQWKSSVGPCGGKRGTRR